MKHRRGFAWLAVLIVVAAFALIVFIGLILYFTGKGTEPTYKNPLPANQVHSEETSSSSVALATGAILNITSSTASSSNVAKKISKAPSINPGNTSSNIQRTANLNTNGVSTTLQIPAERFPTATVSESPLVDNSLPPEMSIDPEAIIGVLCYFNTTFKNPQGQTASGSQAEVRGSGVIIDSRGYILTNRHIVSQPEATTTVTDSSGNIIAATIDYSLDHCEVGQVAAGSRLPTPSEIQSLNPYLQIPVLGYTATPVYISSTYGLSDIEIDAADFAVLEITGLTRAGPTFGVTSVPASFPYVKLFPAGQYLVPGTQVVTYGFPGDITTGQGNAFETLTMTGSVGNVTEVEVGDRFYADTPLVILTDLDVTHGRSGSPLFWRGYIIGLVTFYIGDNRTDSGSVASEAILKALRSTNYNPSYNGNP